jgi:hypothetical protein
MLKKLLIFIGLCAIIPLSTSAISWGDIKCYFNKSSCPITLGATPVYSGFQGGTGIGTTTVGNIGKYLQVSNNSPLTYTFGAGGSGVFTTTTINGLSSTAYTIAAGTNITIATSAPGTITINSTASGTSGTANDYWAITGTTMTATNTVNIVDVNATGTFSHLVSDNEVFSSYLVSNFVGSMDMRGNPWALTGAGLEIATGGLTLGTENGFLKATAGVVGTSTIGISDITGLSTNYTSTSSLASTIAGYYTTSTINASSSSWLSDIYWTGTSTGLVAATGRTSLGLGSMALETATNYPTLTYLGANYYGTSSIGTNYVSTSSLVSTLNGYYTTSTINASSSSWTSDINWNGGGTGLVAATGRTSLGLGDSAVLASSTWPTLTYANTNYAATSSLNNYLLISATGTLVHWADATTTNWNTAYSNYGQWSGTSTGLVAATGRTSLGLGSMALVNTTDYLATGTLGVTVQPYNVNTATTGSAITGFSGIVAYNHGGTGTSTALASQYLWWGDGAGNLVQIASSTLAGSATLSGGQANYLPKWTSASSLSTTTIYDSSGNIGIGTTSPAYTLDVYGQASMGTGTAVIQTNTDGTITLPNLAGSSNCLSVSAAGIVGTSTCSGASGVSSLNTLTGGITLWGTSPLTVTASGTAGLVLAYTEADPLWVASSTNWANWNTAYTDRLKWDGGATGLTAATGRTSLGLGDSAVLASSTWTTPSFVSTNYVSTTTGLTYLLGSASSSFAWRTNNLSDLSNTSTARINLGLGDSSLLASSTWLKVANNLSDGVTSTMRTNLGLVIGTNVQAYNANTATTGSTMVGLWNGTAITNTYGGTGQNSSGWTGYPYVTAGTWSTTTAVKSLNTLTGNGSGLTLWGTTNLLTVTASGTAGLVFTVGSNVATTGVATLSSLTGVSSTLTGALKATAGTLSTSTTLTQGSYSISVVNPTTTIANACVKKTFAYTITRVSGNSDLSTTTQNLQIRTEASPNTGGSLVLSSSLAIGISGTASSTSFSSSSVPALSPVCASTTAVVGGTGTTVMFVEYTITP